MAQRQRHGSRRRNENKLRKFFRLVALLTVKKYGTWIILNLYFTVVLGACIGAMDDIWSEFQRFQSCQEDYIGNVASTVTGSYNDAAHALARSSLGRVQCYADIDMCDGAVDVGKGVVGAAKDGASAALKSVGGRKLDAECAPKGFAKTAFGWSAPGRVNFPSVNMTIESNTDEVVNDVQDDVSLLKEMAKWTRYAGYILAGVSLILIIITAAVYTIRSKPWKPTRKSYVMQLLNVLRVIGAYGIAMLIIFLQAYSTDKFCNVSIKSIYMDTPSCKVTPKCDFKCAVETTKFPNTCEQCDIKLHWWWVEVFALPNILAAVYFIFLALVLVFECIEARFEKKELGLNDDSDGIESRKGSRTARKEKPRKEQKARLVDTANEDSAVVQVDDAQQDDHNVLDAPADVERPVSTPQNTRYESAVYMYPEKTYTGGLY